MSYPNITNDLNNLESRFQQFQTNLINLVYPVGSIYMSVNNVSPATFLGGDWEQIKDKFLLTSGDTYSAGSTGGEAKHTLTVAETPAHTHTRGSMEIIGAFYIDPFVSNGVGVHSTSGAFYETKKSYGTSGSGWAAYGAAGNYATTTGGTFQASRNWTGSTSSVGSGQSHNNMPPYLTVYCWKRTA